MPKVSVLLPMYNSRAYLAEAYESVLRQAFADYEIVILDDSSTDDSVAIVESYRHPHTRIIKLPKSGYVRNLNIGLDLCDSPYIARFDSDDVMLPERLALQSRYLDSNPSVVACGCQAERIDAKGKLLGKLVYDCEPAIVRYRLLLDSPLPHPGTMYRKSDVLHVGKYREDCMPCEDYDLWVRLGSRGRIVNLPDTLLRYRTHGTNISTLREQTLIANRQRIRNHQLLDLGLATTNERAQRFSTAMTAAAEEFTLADYSVVRDIWKRFARRLKRDGYSASELGHLKRWLRWQATARADACSATASAKWLWYALALAIAPPRWAVGKG